MTMHGEDEIDTVERALTEAYRARLDPPVSPGVMQQVMREIRRSGGRNGRWNLVMGDERLVWRTAAVAAALAAVVAMVSVEADRTTTGENGALFAEDIELAYLLGEE